MKAETPANPRFRRLLPLSLLAVLAIFVVSAAVLRPSQADSSASTDLIRGPIGPTGCVQCHEAELAAWQATHHFQSKKVLFSKEGRGITKKLGLKGLPHKQELCQTCHVTMFTDGGKTKPKAKWGVSCESCHSPSKNWIEVHGKLTPHKTVEEEPAAHRTERLAAAAKRGMILPSDIFSLAANCFSCHTVPQESLVNTGGHSAGSAAFELLAWSQGEVRHRFMRGNANKEAPADRRQMLYVVGQMADLWGSLKALGSAKADGAFATAMKLRITNAQAALGKIAEALGEGEASSAVKEIAGSVAADALKHGNAEVLNAAAAAVEKKGKAFAATYEGKDALGKVDPLLPTARQGTPFAK